MDVKIQVSLVVRSGEKAIYSAIEMTAKNENDVVNDEIVGCV
jgi:hypothetical protein